MIGSLSAFRRYAMNRFSFDTVEQLLAIFVDRDRRLVGEQMWDGTVDSVSVETRVIFQFALETGAAGLLLAHNHPSKDLTFSAQDLIMTRKVACIARGLEMQLLDHVVLVSGGGFNSLREQGYL